jgi:hypothetical protein
MLRDVEPGLHSITSEVSWEIRGGTKARRECISYTRFVVGQQLHR